MKYDISRLNHDNRKCIFINEQTHQKIKDYAEMSNRTMQFMLQEMIDKGERLLRAEDYK